MAENLVCWKCGASIADLPVPLSRRAICSGCGAELHVCLMCRFYDKARSNQCQEPVAEAVQYKHKANFCGYFQVKADAWQEQDTKSAQSAKNDLAALFGEDVTAKLSSSNAGQSKAELEKLFGLDGDSEQDEQKK